MVYKGKSHQKSLGCFSVKLYGGFHSHGSTPRISILILEMGFSRSPKTIQLLLSGYRPWRNPRTIKPSMDLEQKWPPDSGVRQQEMGEIYPRLFGNEFAMEAMAP